MAQDDKPTLVQRPAGYDKLVPKGYKNVAKDKVYKKLEDITKTDVATFIAEMTPVIGDAIAAKEVYDEIQKDDPNWLLIGALGGATIIGAVPFVGDAASKLIKKGARQALDVAKRIEVNPNAIGSLGGNIRIKAAQEVVEDFVPQKTVKAYKLFTKGKDGKLYPLFVDAQKEVPTDKWLAATFPDYRFTADNGKQYVPSKGTDGKPGTGDSINIPDQETRDKLIEAGFLPKGSKAKAVKAVAARPGWHAGDVPIATHIGPETNIGGKQVKYRGDDQVWAEIEMPADVDWQQIANSKARIKKDGNIDVRTADINDEMPKAGHYRYKTNPNMTGEWLISGDMKVNRVLDRSEVNAINEAAGVKDLPTLSELNKGYSKGGTVMDDYQYAEMMGNGYAVGGVVEGQTEMAFADGGLPVDPVSGNEVPPGSLPEEVRDDIKVGVSEGEYIVPADVLRYYGMKFFEDLRAEAKVALSGMEQDGRMGGEPMGGEPMMEAPMEEGDDLPFSTEELISEDQMSEGGYMRGYAVGGITTPEAAATAYPDTQMANIFGTSDNTGGIQYVTYYGPNGEIITIQTFNGSPMTPVPSGYTTTPPVATSTDPVSEVAAASNDGNDRDAPDTPKGRKPVNEMTDKEVISELGSVGGMGDKFGIGLATVLGSLVNPALGIKAGSLAKKGVLDRNWEVTKRATDIRSGMSNPAQQATFDKELANALRSVGDRTRSKEETGLFKQFFDNITGKNKIEKVDGGAGLVGATNTVAPRTAAQQAARNQYLTTRQTTAPTDQQVIQGAVSTRDFVRSNTDKDAESNLGASATAARESSTRVAQGKGSASEKATEKTRASNNTKAVEKASKMKGGVTKANVEKSGGKWASGGRAKGGLMTKKK